MAAADFYKSRGISPILFDDNKENMTDELINNIEKLDLNKVGLVVISPGISEENELCTEFEKKKIDVISELELGYRNVQGKMIAVTGTNGKTTTVSLINHILNFGNKDSYSAGNIGIPLISLHNQTNKKSYIVCEVSSFQLMKIKKFKPKISAILNLAPDHLDRHKSFEEYVKAKSRIFENQSLCDFCVLNYDDEEVRRLKENIKARILYFSMENQMANRDFKGVFYDYGKIFYKRNKSEKILIMQTNNVKLLGNKNIENIMCAVLVSVLCGVEPATIEEAVNLFEPLPNRLETVLEKNNISYVNDSKATNVASTLADVNSVENRIVLLLGGSDKGENFLHLFKNLPKRVIYTVVYGATKEKMKRCASKAGFNRVTYCEDFETAVEIANNIALELRKYEGKICILLAPACASFDEFKNYEERGKRFKEIVQKLNHKV